MKMTRNGRIGSIRWIMGRLRSVSRTLLRILSHQYLSRWERVVARAILKEIGQSLEVQTILSGHGLTYLSSYVKCWLSAFCLFRSWPAAAAIVVDPFLTGMILKIGSNATHHTPNQKSSSEAFRNATDIVLIVGRLSRDQREESEIITLLLLNHKAYYSTSSPQSNVKLCNSSRYQAISL